jgi:hypothetical protein
MKTLLFIRPLPTETIPAPWAKALRLIDQPTPFPPLTQPILRMRLDMEEADWRVAFYWVIKKKWNSKLKLPLKRKQATLYEPRGELLFRALELCERLHNVAHPESRRYLHAADWYLHLIQEAKRLGNNAIIQNRGSGKTQSVKERYTIIRNLKDLTNPANPQTSIHFHRLIEVALSLEHQDQFNDHYWKPFLHACSQWTQLTDSRACQETFIEDHKIMQRCGRGKRKITLFRLFQNSVFEALST